MAKIQTIGFITKVERLDPRLKVQHFKDLHIDDNGEKVYMIVWYTCDDGFKLPFVMLAYHEGLPVVKTYSLRFSKSDLALYSKVIELCMVYFPPVIEGVCL